MNGKIVAGAIVIAAAGFGAVVWYSQVYGYWQASGPEAAEVVLTSRLSGAPEAIVTEAFEGIQADSSPLRFRGCFTTPLSLGLLTETYLTYPNPEPTIAPGWFGCFDAQAIGAALESGEAVAFLSQRDIQPGVDRVVAVFPDGRAFAWNQINETLEQ